MWEIRRKIIELFPNSLEKVQVPAEQKQVPSGRSTSRASASSSSSSRVKSSIVPSKSTTGKSSRPTAVSVGKNKLPSVPETVTQTVRTSAASPTAPTILPERTAAAARAEEPGVTSVVQPDSRATVSDSPVDGDAAKESINKDGNQSEVDDENNNNTVNVGSGEEEDIPGSMLYRGHKMVPFHVLEDLQKEYARLTKISKELKVKVKPF